MEFLKRAFALILLFAPLACGYRLGFHERALPGGYNQVAIVVFKNSTNEVGIETYFTNELIRQMARSGVARVVDKEDAAVVLEGIVEDLRIVRSAKATQNEIKLLPLGAVLTTEYRIHLSARVLLRRISDNKIIWQDVVQNERAYSAPNLGSAGINSADALYNQSDRHQNIAKMAEDMMDLNSGNIQTSLLKLYSSVGELLSQDYKEQITKIKKCRQDLYLNGKNIL